MVILNFVARSPPIVASQIFYDYCVSRVTQPTKFNEIRERRAFKSRQGLVLHQFGATTDRSIPIGYFITEIAADIFVVESKFIYTLIMTMFYVLGVLSLFGSAMAQITASGACPQVQVQPNFDSLKVRTH